MKKFDEKTLRKLFFLVGAVFIVLLLIQLFLFYVNFNPFEWFTNLPFVQEVYDKIIFLLDHKSYSGVFLFFSLAALFFLPSPLELFYFGFLSQGFSFPKLYLTTLLGIFVAQHVNYLLGRFFGRILRRFANEKTIDKYMERLEKYGQYFILFMHMFPLPYAILNFVVGLSKFNYVKWVRMMMLGLAFDYLLIYAVFLIF